MFKWLVGTIAASVLALMLAPALVTAGPSTGYLEVCKASDGSAVAGTFRFTVAAQTVEVPVGACSAPMQLPAGVVTVTEEAVAGVGVVDIAVSPADRQVSTSIPSRSAQVNIVAGGVSTQTIVTFTNRSETGVLTVCKVAGPGIATGTNFTFIAAGRALAVPAGQCVGAGSFPYGSHVTIAEVLEPGTRVSDISIIPNRMVGNPSLTDGVVTVAIGPGVTQASFTNEAVPQGFIQICKRSDASNVTGIFTFVVAAHRVDVPVGGCSGVLRVPEGTVTVTEVATDNTVVTGVSTSPTSRLIASDLPGRSAQVRIVAGDLTQMAIVTFTNHLQSGQVKVCKVAGSGVTLGAPFTFNVAGQALSVPAGSCVLAGNFPLNQRVTVTETVPSGMHVAAIRVDPPERISGVPNVASGSVTVLTGPGVTEVTVTNQSSPAATTTTVPTPLVAPTTTAPMSTTSTIPTTSTTVPQATTTTTPGGGVLATTSTTAPVATTTTAPGLLAATTSTTAPAATTTTAPGLLTATTSTSTTVAPLGTTTTLAGTLAATTSTSTPLAATTTTTPASLATTSTTAAPAAITSTTAVPSTTSTTAGPAVLTPTTIGLLSATTTTVAPCIPSGPLSSASSIVPTPATTPTTGSHSSPSTTAGPSTGMPELCDQPSALSTPTTIVGRLVEQATIPLTAARLALTGSPTSLLVALALVLLLIGLTAIRLSEEQVADRSADRDAADGKLATSVGPRAPTELSGRRDRVDGPRPPEAGVVLRR